MKMGIGKSIEPILVPLSGIVQGFFPQMKRDLLHVSCILFPLTIRACDTDKYASKFQLFLDDTKMKNFVTCFKGKFVVFDWCQEWFQDSSSNSISEIIIIMPVFFLCLFRKKIPQVFLQKAETK